MGLSWTVWDFLGFSVGLSGTISGTFLDCLGLIGTLCWTFWDSLWDFLGLSGTFSNSVGLSGTLLDCLRLFEAIWDSLGLSGTLFSFLQPWSSFLHPLLLLPLAGVFQPEGSSHPLCEPAKAC